MKITPSVGSGSPTTSPKTTLTSATPPVGGVIGQVNEVQRATVPEAGTVGPPSTTIEWGVRFTNSVLMWVLRPSIPRNQPTVFVFWCGPNPRPYFQYGVRRFIEATRQMPLLASVGEKP